jgi:hypothetical protein
MTREERLAILGAEVVAHIHARVAAAPEPSDELVEELRRIMTNPAGLIPKARPAVGRSQNGAGEAHG